MAGGSLLTINIYVNNLPDYGIRSKWKKLLLKTMLPDDVPKVSIANALAVKGKVLFLDTRAKEEFDVSHIEGAVFTGYKEFHLAVLKDIPKDQPIIVYCSIGKRSGDIGAKLIKAGYVNVQNLYGGIFEWINKGFPVVDNQNNLTQKVHAYNQTWGKWLNRGEKVY